MQLCKHFVENKESESLGSCLNWMNVQWKGGLVMWA